MRGVATKLLSALTAAMLALGAGTAASAAATAPIPYQDRPALKLRNVAEAVMLGVAKAGARLVAVGERGAVGLSDDGGKSWRQAAMVPVDVTLTAVQFIDAAQGWAVGHAGVILATKDGGEHWSKQFDGQAAARLAEREAAASGDARLAREAARLVADGADKPLLAVHFSSPRQGIAVGAYNLIVATEDGGANWHSLMGRLDNPQGAHLYAVNTDGQFVYIAGEQGVFFVSSDGGRSFQRRELPYKGSWFSMARDGDSLVLAGLRGTAYRSPDRGRTWTRLGEAPPVSFVSAVPLQGRSVLLANQSGQLFVSADDGLRMLKLPPVPPVTQAAALGDGQVLLLTVQGILRQGTTEVYR
jgi:photosystem II stability/assembly factor-like uncharacterized protein